MDKLFFALSDPTRRNIIELLASKGELAASDIYKEFQVSNPAISQHLKVLRQASLVKVAKARQQRLYQINQTKFSELARWTTEMQKVWKPRFSNLEKILQTK